MQFLANLAVIQWLESTWLSTSIRESTLLFPAIITVHVLTVFLSAGTIIALDLRLLGWGLKKTPLSVVFEQLRPWTLAFFAINFAAGILLFISEPVKCAKTASFILKMASLGILGLNALAFDRGLYPTLGNVDTAVALPARARLAGGTSLFFWAVVIFCGRWTAYF
jgi:hypothetical protein